MNIIIVGGYPSSGKTQFVKFCQEYIGTAYCLDISTVDLVKKVAKCAGWDGSKTPKNRCFLADLKKLLIEWDDVPHKDVMATINRFEEMVGEFGVDTGKCFAFVQCREPEEIKKFVERVGARTLCIERPNHEPPVAECDKTTISYMYDIVIANDGDLEKLRQSARTYVDYIISSNK